MDIRFKDILVPVDFSVNTEIAVKKALELIQDKEGTIHLLYVNVSFFSGKGKEELAVKRLNEWRLSIQEIYPGIKVETYLHKGHSVQLQVDNLARKIQPQLIVIGKHNYHNWLSFLNTIDPDKLGKSTNCPVLTVKLGSLHNKIKSIVFPVKTFVPNRKIELLITIAKIYRARIYLVILTDPEKHTEASPLYHAFVETYRLLKASLSTPIEHKIASGSSLVRASLDFARSINADMILVSPDTENRVSLLSRQQVNDVVKGNSKLAVLSVEPGISINYN
jgi:nucleotide-binding universal stress UspA family protein